MYELLHAGVGGPNMGCVYHYSRNRHADACEMQNAICRFSATAALLSCVESHVCRFRAPSPPVYNFVFVPGRLALAFLNFPVFSSAWHTLWYDNVTCWSRENVIILCRKKKV